MRLEFKLRLLSFLYTTIFGTLLLPTLAEPTASVKGNTIVLTERYGEVQLKVKGTLNWVTITNRASDEVTLRPGDAIKTSTNGQAIVNWKDKDKFRSFLVNERTEITIRSDGNRYQLDAGSLSAINNYNDNLRSLTNSVIFDMHGVNAFTIHTEFAISVVENGSGTNVVVSALEGGVVVTNAAGSAVTLGPGDQVVVAGGKMGIVHHFEFKDLMEWCFYYPAILDPEDLKLSNEEASLLSPSLEAYRVGDLRLALTKYPDAVQDGSDDVRVYHAALLLSAAQVDKARLLLDSMTEQAADSRHKRLGDAFRMMIAVVKREPFATRTNAILRTEFMANSYNEQRLARSDGGLQNALSWATKAAIQSSNGLAWQRVAEVATGLGQNATAQNALSLSLKYSPSSAQSVTLDGYLLLARNRTPKAIERFDHAVLLDPAYGGAWFGRGLAHYRLRERSQALADLKTAVAKDPLNSLPRVYLAKIWSDLNATDSGEIEKQLKRAKTLSPNDPTPWLYSGLIHDRMNQPNEAVGDLEQSLERNDNRMLFRSEYLLDDDRAVRGTGLARLYQRDGLTDVSLREAARAVATDYGNYSAHLFLAESYDALRDPTRFNLAYETVWFNQLLLADLLAPVGAGTFSSNVSLQEYGRLLTAEGFTTVSMSEYRSDGQFRQLVTQSGFFGNSAYSLDLDYQHNDGTRPNNDLDRIEWYTHVKQQVTEHDTALLLVKFEDYHSGDNFQYLDPLARTNGYLPSFRYDEYQQPIVLTGWRHEWSPGFQTLALAGRLENDQQFHQDGLQFLERVTNKGVPIGLNQPKVNLSYRGQQQIYTGELNQIAEFGSHTLVLGGRFQGGSLGADYRLTDKPNSALASIFPNEINQNRGFDDGFQSSSLYAYESWTPLSSLVLTAGIAYVDLRYPANFRHPPLQSDETSVARTLPKAALVWTPHASVTLRGIYAKSLGGVGLDESYRLEPSELAGFSQAFRSLIPESVAGSVSAPGFDVGGAALDLKLPARTYLGLRGDFLRSAVDQQTGLFNFDQTKQKGVTGGTPEHFGFTENVATLTLDKLLGDEWSLGGSYRFQGTQLDNSYPVLGRLIQSDVDLHEFGIRVGWTHVSGWFARGDTTWYLQDHKNSNASFTDGNEDTCQVDVQVGWRFPGRHGELSGGILNLLDRDYRLDPLSALPEFARERVFFARLKLSL